MENIFHAQKIFSPAGWMFSCSTENIFTGWRMFTEHGTYSPFMENILTSWVDIFTFNRKYLPFAENIFTGLGMFTEHGKYFPLTENIFTSGVDVFRLVQACFLAQKMFSCSWVHFTTLSGLWPPELYVNPNCA
jgi:hypothetical protein